MRKSKSLALLVVSALFIGACTPANGTSSSDSSGSASASGTSSIGSSSSSSSSSSEVVIEHQNPFVSEIETPSALRDFDERYDAMGDDFSGAAINGTTTGEQTPSFLRTLVDSSDVNEPISADASIYKWCSGSYDTETYDGIGFKMRIAGNKELKISNLALGLRGSDQFKVYPINLGEALNPDGEALPELSSEFQDFIVSPGQSIVDANTEYLLPDGTTSSGVKVLNEVLGFHLYALGAECSAVVEISEVYLIKAGEKTIIDDFSRSNVGLADSTCWWRGSTGFIVQKGVTLAEDESYTLPAVTSDTHYENIVLSILGDTTGASLVLPDATEVAWSSLKDSADVAVSNAVDGAFYHFVLNGADQVLNAGVTLKTTTALTIAQAFYTNMETPQAAVEYPLIDVDRLAMFDNYNRTQSGFGGDWDAASTDATTLAAGLAAQLSYNNADKVSVDGSALVFDATNLAASDYIEYKACNNNIAIGQYKYMVMAVKAENGATLDNFRIMNNNSTAVYYNQMLSGEGLPVATLGQEGYDYNVDGYTWLIVDLGLSGLHDGDVWMEYYYSGLGKLSIDFVAYANAYGTATQDNLAVDKEYLDAGYAYAGYVYSPAGSRFIKVAYTTDDPTATIDPIRFEVAGGATFWFHEGNLKDETGATISGDTLASGTTVVIDLVASGLKAAASDAIGIHVHGNGFDGKSYSIKVYSVDLVVMTQDTLYVDKVYLDSNYAYAGYVWSPSGSQYLKVAYTTDSVTATIDPIRFEVAGGATFWFHEGNLKDATGAVISGDTLASGAALTIDLVASGLKAAASDAIGIHVHGNGFDGASYAVKVSSVDPIPAFKSLSAFTEVAIADLSGYNYVGWCGPISGVKYLRLTLKSTAGCTLSSFRFGDGNGAEKWFKDGALIGDDGNVIDAATPVTADGVTLTIDVEASGMAGWANVHLHCGGDATGDATVSLEALYARGTAAYVIAALPR